MPFTPSRPIRFPQGLTTFPPRHVLQTFPSTPLTTQTVAMEDFAPYRSIDYTVTTAVAGTVATFPALSGMVRFATSASATDTIFLQRNGFAAQILPGNQLWSDTRLAFPRTVNNSSDATLFWGLFDAATPTLANNGIYFTKFAGSVTASFVIKKNGVITTWVNLGDLTTPSGIFNDTNSVNGTLNIVAAGNSLIAVNVVTAGAGYQIAPLVLTTASSGSAGQNLVSVALGSSALSQSNPPVPLQTTGLPYGTLFAPYLTAPGSGLTNTSGSTAYLEVIPVLNYSIWFDGKGTLYVGINGRQVLSFGGTATGLGVVGVAPGSTINPAIQPSQSYYSTAQLGTALAPFQPAIGSAYNMLPQVPMTYVAGISNSTANIRTLFLDAYSVATEAN